MVTVHHLNNSRSQRILWMLEELQVPYELKRAISAIRQPSGTARVKKIHPLGKSPVITDGDLTLAESGAIIEYLQETYDAQGRYLNPPVTMIVSSSVTGCIMQKVHYKALLVMKLIF